LSTRKSVIEFILLIDVLVEEEDSIKITGENIPSVNLKGVLKEGFIGSFFRNFI
jgi:hypothetical protein